MTTREITRLAGISKGENTRRELRKLESIGFIICISSAVKKSRLYAITEKGLKYLKRKFHSIDYNNYLYDTLLQEKNIEWDTYAWIINSKRRQDILQVTKKDYPKTAKQIRIDSREDIAKRISAIKTREILRDFLEKGLVQAKKEKHERRVFCLTEKGFKIFGMMLR